MFLKSLRLLSSLSSFSSIPYTKNTIHSRLFMKRKNHMEPLSHFETFGDTVPQIYTESFRLIPMTQCEEYTGLFNWRYNLSTILITSPIKQYKEVILFNHNYDILTYHLQINNYSVRCMQSDIFKNLSYKQTDCSCCRWL